MSRVVKARTVRQAELIEIARALFFERGYERTSVDEIIARAGVSKGAFYHHFPSKDALLEVLAEQIAEESAEQAAEATRDPCLIAFERLDLFLVQGRRLKTQQAREMLQVFETLFMPENLELYHRIFVRVSRRILPLLSDIVRQGMEEQVFLPGDPTIIAEIVLSMTTATHDAVADLLRAEDEHSFRLASEAFEKRWAMQAIAVDRVLGLPDGSITFVEPGFADAFFAGWRQRRARL